MVSDYLVTSEGLQELIRKPVFRGKIEDSLYRKLEEWSQSELSFGDLALKVWSSEQWEQLKVRAEQSARQFTARCRGSMARIRIGGKTAEGACSRLVRGNDSGLERPPPILC